ncbi:MAG TPA: DinB family protein [Candidatus Limnocylindrales bacterium]
MTIGSYPGVPGRLAPFLAQWDYMSEQLLARLQGITDEEYLWEPAPVVWTVRPRDGRGEPDQTAWAPEPEAAPPRTLAWSIGHLGWGSLIRADWLVGSHSLMPGDADWPTSAADGVTFLRTGLAAWRDGIGTMTDPDLDTVGRSAYPGGLDPTLPLLDIVWWVNKELIEHTAEIWFVRDLYAALRPG